MTFNDNSRVIRTSDKESTYKITDICLSYDTVTHPELTHLVGSQYAGRIGIYYDSVHRHQKLTLNASDMLWNLNINVPCCSLRGVLVLFEESPEPFNRVAEKCYNPKISKIEITVEGQLFGAGMRLHHQWTEAQKFFAGGSKRDPTVAAAAKDLYLSIMNIGTYLTTFYALWLDMRTSDDDQLHGNGRQILNAIEGMTIHIQK